MWLYIIIFVIAAALMLGITACIPQSGRISNFRENDSIFLPYDSASGKASREEIIHRLELLAKSEAPTQLNPGAMCYEMAMPPDRIEYQCPVCGSKTLYTQDALFSLVESAGQCRHIVSNIPGLDLRLEERGFCRKCQPDTNQNLLLVLHIKYRGEQKEEAYEGITPEGLQLLREFMTGDKTHDFFNEREEPLRDYVDEISAILKIKSKK